MGYNVWTFMCVCVCLFFFNLFLDLSPVFSVWIYSIVTVNTTILSIIHLTYRGLLMSVIYYFILILLYSVNAKCL